MDDTRRWPIQRDHVRRKAQRQEEAILEGTEVPVNHCRPWYAYAMRPWYGYE